jgi:hypothetical protein
MLNLEISPLKISSLKISPLKISPLEISPLEISPLEISPLKISSLEISPLKISSLKISSLMISPKVGRTPWSARVPLDPLSQTDASPGKAGQGAGRGPGGPPHFQQGADRTLGSAVEADRTL